jgi:alpha-D-xyloside xylohydrolase
MMKPLVLSFLLQQSASASAAGEAVGEVRIEAWGNHSCRIRAAPPGQSVAEQATPSALLPLEQAPRSRTARTAGSAAADHHREGAVLVNGNIRCEVSASGVLGVTRVSDGAVLVHSAALAFGGAPRYPHDPGFFQASVAYTSGAPAGGGTAGATAAGEEEEERMYGFGETRTGVVNQVAARIHPPDDDDDDHVHPPLPPTRSFFQNFSLLATYGHSVGGQWSVPVYHSSRGYSFLWNMPSFGSVNVTAPPDGGGGASEVRWFSDATRQIDLLVTTTAAAAAASAAAAGSVAKQQQQQQQQQQPANRQPSPFPELLERYADATGHAPPVPAFASGFWQSRNRYRNQTQLLAIAAGYAARGLPLAAIVIDYFHWKTLGDWSFNAACWPDPAAMTGELAARNVTVMASVWPMSNRSSAHYAELLSRGMLSLYENGTAQPMDTWCDGHVYDPFSAATRARFFEFLKAGYVQHGITAFWLDADEPEHILAADNGHWKYSGGWDSAIGMAFPLLHQQMVMDGLRAEGFPPIERIALSRAAWAGSQRHGIITWSGDIHSTFDELALQVRTAQGVAMSGIPLWTTDIGGYQGGDLGDPVFEELIVRWMQFGVFCPITRLHGIRGGCNITTDAECGTDNCANEVWAFEHYDILGRLLHMRESLRAYVEEGLREAQATGMPLLRPMFLEFPDDPVCSGAGTDVDGQYMFGSAYLVAPVTTYGATSANVYLPALPSGAQWTYAFNKSVASGGQWVSVDTPLDEFPLFTRDSS